MKKGKRNYSPTFKKKVVELSYSGGTVKQVFEEFDIPLFSVTSLA